MSDDIKPRIDEDGVGWCDAGCPQYTDPMTKGPAKPACAIDMPGAANRWPMYEACPVHARRMAQWAGRAHGVMDKAQNPHQGIGADCVPLYWRAAFRDVMADYPGKQGGA